MRRLSALALTAAVLAASGCTGAREPPGGGSAAPAPGKVSLPDDPAALADLADRQIRRMTSVRMTATTRLGETEGGTITAALGRSGNQPAAALRFEEAPSGTLEIVQGLMIGGTFYMRDLNNDAAPGKPWLRLSARDVRDPRLGKTSKVFRTAVGQVAAAVKRATGTSDMANIRPGRLTAAPVDDTIDGVRVRRYAGTTALARLPGGEQDDQDRQVLAILARNGVKRFPWRLWIDRSGLPRRFAVTLRIADRGTFSAQTTYRAWGAPVEVKAPPPNRVTGLADLAGP